MVYKYKLRIRKLKTWYSMLWKHQMFRRKKLFWNRLIAKSMSFSLVENQKHCWVSHIVLTFIFALFHSFYSFYFISPFLLIWHEKFWSRCVAVRMWSHLLHHFTYVNEKCSNAFYRKNVRTALHVCRQQRLKKHKTSMYINNVIRIL